MNISKERLLAMRERHPAGTRITLQSMNDPYSRLQPGDTGTLVLIDDIGTYHVHWDNGSSLGLIPGEDSFSCQPPEQHELKLWMPMTASLDLMDDPDDSDAVLLDGYDLARYEDEIQDALAEYADAEGQARGLMHRYREGGGLSMKVQSVFLSAEVRDDRLWAVADCTVSGELTPEELKTLKEYISGQASDGWGESFEQHEIHIDDGELYVHLWNSRNWDIRTEEEGLAVRFAPGLPEKCFSVLSSTGELILLKRGEGGFYHSTWSTDSREENRRLADEGNERLNVTPAQRRAMEVGSMFGWDVPGADPAEYEAEEGPEQDKDEPSEGPVMTM